MRMNKVYNRIESIIGNVITVRAEGVKYKELAQITTRFGKSLAQVNKIDGDIVSLQVFAGGQGVSNLKHFNVIMVRAFVYLITTIIFWRFLAAAKRTWL